MKKAFILAGCASVIIACNTNSNNIPASHDSSNHAAHNERNSNSNDQKEMNPITETMEKMMHDMHGATSTGNNDVDFAAMMIQHHKGAVEMSKVQIEKGNNTELKAFAQKVIEDQNEEINFMQEYVSNLEKTASANSAEFQKALHNSMKAMMNDNTTIYNNIDKDFAAQMIPHHQSAVDMAKVYLEYGQEERLRTLCQNIINSQTKEINWLKEWLAKRG